MHYAGGALIFGVFIVVALFVFIYSTYTRRGSGIRVAGHRPTIGGAAVPAPITYCYADVSGCGRADKSSAFPHIQP